MKGNHGLNMKQTKIQVVSEQLKGYRNHWCLKQMKLTLYGKGEGQLTW